MLLHAPQDRFFLCSFNVLVQLPFVYSLFKHPISLRLVSSPGATNKTRTFTYEAWKPYLFLIISLVRPNVFFSSR